MRTEGKPDACHLGQAKILILMASVCFNFKTLNAQQHVSSPELNNSLPIVHMGDVSDCVAKESTGVFCPPTKK